LLTDFFEKFPWFFSYISCVKKETHLKEMKIFAKSYKKNRKKLQIVISFKATGSGSVYNIRFWIQDSQKYTEPTGSGSDTLLSTPPKPRPIQNLECRGGGRFVDGGRGLFPGKFGGTLPGPFFCPVFGELDDNPI